MVIFTKPTSPILIFNYFYYLLKIHAHLPYVVDNKISKSSVDMQLRQSYEDVPPQV